MRRNLLVLLIGIFVGWLITILLLKPTPPPAESPKAQARQPQSASLEIITVPAPQPRAAETLAVAPPVPKGRAMKLRFPEALLTKLELQISQVRESAYSIRRSEGWEIKFLTSQSPLSELGLQSGDIIPDEAIEDIQVPGVSQKVTNLLADIER